MILYFCKLFSKKYVNKVIIIVQIISLLDLDMDVHAAQSTDEKITIAQVCFIIRELLNMLENEVTENYLRDLVSLLPKVCKKLQQIVADLRQEDNVHEKEAARLIFCLFICIFNWKEFGNSRYYNLLRGDDYDSYSRCDSYLE